MAGWWVVFHRVSRPGVLPSPNIWHWPERYELENRAQDVEGAIWSALAERVSWHRSTVVDVGCGDGFHLPVFAATARDVVGIEPYRPLLRRAERRVAGMSNVRVAVGSAQRVPLPDSSVDLVHARTAYFFGPGCEPGLREADRLLRPGGALAIVDLDITSSPYGDWMRTDLPELDAATVASFFARHGFHRQHVDTVWRFADRSDMETVLRIEFSPKVAAMAMAQTVGLTIPVRYRIDIRHKPHGLHVVTAHPARR